MVSTYWTKQLHYQYCRATSRSPINWTTFARNDYCYLTNSNSLPSSRQQLRSSVNYPRARLAVRAWRCVHEQRGTQSRNSRVTTCEHVARACDASGRLVCERVDYTAGLSTFGIINGVMECDAVNELPALLLSFHSTRELASAFSSFFSRFGIISFPFRSFLNSCRLETLTAPFSLSSFFWDVKPNPHNQCPAFLKYCINIIFRTA